MQALRTVEDRKSQDKISKNNETERPKCQKWPETSDRRLNKGFALKKGTVHQR